MNEFKHLKDAVREAVVECLRAKAPRTLKEVRQYVGKKVPTATQSETFIRSQLTREAVQELAVNHGTEWRHAWYLPDQHVLYQDGDDDIPDSITDSNGEVVLGLCKLCGAAERELDERPCDGGAGWDQLPDSKGQDVAKKPTSQPEGNNEERPVSPPPPSAVERVPADPDYARGDVGQPGNKSAVNPQTCREDFPYPPTGTVEATMYALDMSLVMARMAEAQQKVERVERMAAFLQEQVDRLSCILEARPQDQCQPVSEQRVWRRGDPTVCGWGSGEGENAETLLDRIRRSGGPSQAAKPTHYTICGPAGWTFMRGPMRIMSYRTTREFLEGHARLIDIIAAMQHEMDAREADHSRLLEEAHALRKELAVLHRYGTPGMQEQTGVSANEQRMEGQRAPTTRPAQTEDMNSVVHRDDDVFPKNEKEAEELRRDMER